MSAPVGPVAVFVAVRKWGTPVLNGQMKIRAETPSDYETIYRLTKAAFDPMPFSDGTEADAITVLREDGDLTLSLVATGDAGLLGHIAFSPVFVDGHRDGWFGLGPVSVWPHLQRTGIGSALVKEGLSRLRQMRADGCVLIGDPRYLQPLRFRVGQRARVSRPSKPTGSVACVW